jgi:hypothetical protein
MITKHLLHDVRSLADQSIRPAVTFTPPNGAERRRKRGILER